MPTQLSFMDQWSHVEDIMDPAAPDPTPRDEAPLPVEVTINAPAPTD